MAYLVAAVSKQPRDRLKINVDEQRVIQELRQELSLSKDELEEIESSAMQELNQNRSPIKLVKDLIFGLKICLTFSLKSSIMLREGTIQDILCISLMRD